jgi:hypothetical protein
MCAPIGISVYSRLEHLKQTVTALQKNTLAKDSAVYFFSDAPKPGDEEKVEELRDYLRGVSGFSEIHIWEREKNGRVANNRGGMKSLSDQFGEFIFLEEDVVTSPGFLQFINDGLEHFRDNPMVQAICGHTPNLKSLLNHKSDYYSTSRFHPWGFGMTRKNYDQISSIDSKYLLEKEKSIKAVVDDYGNDLWNMIVKDARGEVDALDLKICFLQIMAGKVSVLPRMTLVRNIGIDGSGAHCSDEDPYEGHKLWNQEHFEFSNVVEASYRVRREYRKFYDLPSRFQRYFRRFR